MTECGHGFVKGSAFAAEVLMRRADTVERNSEIGTANLAQIK